MGVSMHETGLVLLWLAAALTIWSGYEYIRDAWPELKESSEVQTKSTSQDSSLEE